MPPLHGQAPGTFEAITRYVGKTLVVHDVAGARISGRLIAATATELTLSVNGARDAIPATEIASVGVVGDALWDGALKGAAVGGLLIALGGASVPSCDRPCFRKSALSDVLGVAMFGAIGTWIDHRRTREQTVYVSGRRN